MSSVVDKTVVGSPLLLLLTAVMRRGFITSKNPLGSPPFFQIGAGFLGLKPTDSGAGQKPYFSEDFRFWGLFSLRRIEVKMAVDGLLGAFSCNYPQRGPKRPFKAKIIVFPSVNWGAFFKAYSPWVKVGI